MFDISVIRTLAARAVAERDSPVVNGSILLKKKTDSFFAISEIGDKYLIFEYTDFPEINHFGVKKDIPGPRRYWTSEGMAVYPIGDNLYVIPQLDITLRRLFREPVSSAR